MFARSSDYLEGVSADLSEDALAVPTDPTDQEAIEAGFEAVRDAFGPVDVLVNNASSAAWQGLRDISPDHFERAWRVSASGSLLCSREAVEDMLTGSGRDSRRSRRHRRPDRHDGRAVDGEKP
ncbi:MAG: SDR family NAD(P)-dependent oxidoreductase [Halodesulfurarchaeum sp.]